LYERYVDIKNLRELKEIKNKDFANPVRFDEFVSLKTGGMCPDKKVTASNVLEKCAFDLKYNEWIKNTADKD